MAGFANNFSWSFTRHKTFRECKRQYYHNYYGYWNGWSEDAPDDARLTYRVKKMVTMPMWIGDLVHRMAERILGDLRNRETNSLERYQKQARDLLNREWKQSVDGEWQWKPKYKLNLLEHYYGMEITPEQRVAARDKIFRCLDHFMHSDLFAELETLRTAEWKSVEKLDQFAVGEQPVFVKLDCTTQHDGTLSIFDWKTGRETDDTAVQLGCYAVYAYQVWHTPVEDQRLVTFYLDPGKILEHRPTSEELIETKDFILRSMEEMIEALDSPVAENRVRIDDFPMTTNRRTCRRCFFREVCFGTREWTDAMEAGDAPAPASNA